MNKFITFLVTLFLCLVGLACGSSMKDKASQMKDDLTQAAKSGDIEQFDQVYGNYYQYFQELPEDEQIEFVELTVFDDNVPAEIVEFVTKNITDEEDVNKFPNMVEFGKAAEQVYIKNIHNVKPHGSDAVNPKVNE